MDILIPDSWMREYLDTPAKPGDIAKYISLCGPSVERIEKVTGDYIYHVEITTNRIDSVSIYGFAREVSAILPTFNIPAKLKQLKPSPNLERIDNLNFSIISKGGLVKRAIGVVLTDIKNWQSPEIIARRLEMSGMRSLNAVVDITNIVMLEVGHPSHAFDYDKIKNQKFVIRESVAGEKVTSFDGKTYTLTGGDIVFDDGEGKIIDLPGIIGTKNSVVDENTKKVLFFIDNNDPARIRKTSMGLDIRTVAASINEKGVDPELANTALLKGIELFETICKAKLASKIFDFYPNPTKTKIVKTTKEYIDKVLGVEISKTEISKELTALGFTPTWKSNKLTVKIPSYRADDISIPEDIVEEVARLYGYYKLPSKLMAGDLPNLYQPSTFDTERKIKQILKNLTGIEVYTLSLVPEEFVDINNALRLKNPLGPATEFLRTNLKNSLVDAINSNKGIYEKLFLFEIANVYKPNKSDLPAELLTLGLAFDGYKYTEVKGIVNTLLHQELNIGTNYDIDKATGLISIISKKDNLGTIEILSNGLITAEFDVESIIAKSKAYISFEPIPKYPAQIEDITLSIPKKVYLGEIINTVKQMPLVSNFDLIDTYDHSFTFRIWYQDKNKTLTDQDVKVIRKAVFKQLKSEFDIAPKEN